MVKFKLAFTITAETLFSILPRVLPIEDLSVEEVVDHPAKSVENVAWNKPALAAIAKGVGKHHKVKRRVRRNYQAPKFNQGINGVILKALAGGPAKAVELQPFIKEAGFSPNSVGSRLQFLSEKGIIIHLDDSKWALAEKAN